MTTSPKQLTIKRWVSFTTYGWFVGIVLVVGFALVPELLFKMSDESGGQAAIGIGMGAGVGFMQWMVLRKFLTTSHRMFWGTFIGFSFAFILRDIVTPLIEFPLTVETTIPFAVLLGAFISGWFQYKFVFSKIMAKAVNWIFYSVVAWLLATLITMGMSLLNFKTGEHLPKVLIVIIALLFLSIGGPILGYITGRFIVTKINDISENNSTNAQQRVASIGGDVQN